MVVRLGLVPAVALSVLTSMGAASAQYYPAAEQEAQPTYTAPSTVNEDAQVPAAYDPYAPQSGAAASATAPYAAAPATAPYAAAPSGVPAIAGQPVPVSPGPAQAMAPATPPGYPPGAFSGQQPAGMASPYGNTAAAPQPQGQQPYATGSIAPPASVAPHASSAAAGANGSTVAMLPDEDQPEEGPPKALPENLRRQIVEYPTKEAAGTIVIDTPNTYLYYVLGGGQAERYGIGVGRDGFTWAGTEKISAKKEWADWRPPAEMIERQPYLPRFMAGGPGNPLGARTMYLGGTIYRIHGTNQPSTIGQFMSSGCIRMLNEDVENLFDRVKVGTKVVVLPGNPAQPKTASTAAAIEPVAVSAAGVVQ